MPFDPERTLLILMVEAGSLDSFKQRLSDLCLDSSDTYCLRRDDYGIHHHELSNDLSDSTWWMVVLVAARNSDQAAV